MEAGKAQLKGELPAVALLRYRAAGCITHLFRGLSEMHRLCLLKPIKSGTEKPASVSLGLVHCSMHLLALSSHHLLHLVIHRTVCCGLEHIFPKLCSTEQLHD